MYYQSVNTENILNGNTEKKVSVNTVKSIVLIQKL